MSNVAVTTEINPMSKGAIAKVRQMESLAAQAPQVHISTDHVIHGGMYARSIKIPAGVMITGALIKIATILIVQGEALMYVGDDCRKLEGYSVLRASAHRKQAFVAITDTFLTMIFPTDAKTIQEAEEQFTDETDLLLSRQLGDDTLNGDALCQA